MPSDKLKLLIVPHNGKRAMLDKFIIQRMGWQMQIYQIQIQMLLKLVLHENQIDDENVTLE